MSSANSRANRPLSPHIQIYRWQMTMAMSIVHRITGVGLYFGSLFVAAWLIAAATGPQPFDAINRVLSTWPGQLILFGYTWALIHHMLGGLRHFVWDFGAGMGKPARDRLAIANLVLSVIITFALWAAILWLR